MGLLLGVMKMTGAMDAEEVREARRAPAEVLAYQNFTQSVEAYVAANPTYSGTLTWANIRNAASTPLGMRQASMPSTFKAVVVTGQFVICGELSQAAAARLVSHLPAEMKGQQATIVVPGNPVFQVLGPSTTDFNAEATKCAS